MGAAAIPLLIGSMAVGAVATVAQGRQQEKAYEQQARQAELAAQSQVTERTRALNEAMAVQNAMIGSSGRTGDSLTSVLKGDQKRYEQDALMIKTGAAYQSQQSKAAGSAAMNTAYLNATGGLLSGASKVASLGGGAKPTTTQAK